ncbi:MAG: hypothetical protein M3042_07670 [Actinomycetota bacterium]|nr:hypothetical protein [Actinomycetota bacterium]
MRPAAGIRRDTGGVCAKGNSVMRATIATVPPPYAAYLRVYEPLVAFPEPERDLWRRYVAAGRAPRRSDGPRLEHAHALRRMLSGRLPDPGEHAYVADHDGVALVCPWRTALRAWESAEEFGNDIAGVLLQPFLPPAVAQQAGTDLAAWRLTHPQSRSHIVTATWAVPVRWFVLFAPPERQIRVSAGRREVVYVTEMAKARRRAARALAVLRKGLGENAVTAGVEELARWLEAFHPRSLVELDYGGVVWLFDENALAADESAADVAAALGALSTGDAAGAGAAYERVADRWRPAQLQEAAN